MSFYQSIETIIPVKAGELGTCFTVSAEAGGRNRRFRPPMMRRIAGESVFRPRQNATVGTSDVPIVRAATASTYSVRGKYCESIHVCYGESG